MRRSRGTALLVALAILVALSIVGLSLMLSTARVSVGTRELIRFREVVSARSTIELLKAGIGSGAIPRSDWSGGRLGTSWSSVWQPSGGRLDRFERLGVRPDGWSNLRSFNQSGLVLESFLVSASAGDDSSALVSGVLEIRGQPFETGSIGTAPSFLDRESRFAWFFTQPAGHLGAADVPDPMGALPAGQGERVPVIWDAKETIDFASGYPDFLRPGALLRTLEQKEAESRGKVSFWPGRGILTLTAGQLRPMTGTTGSGNVLPKAFGSPVLVGRPNNVWYTGTDLYGYVEFAWKQASRRRMVLSSSDVAAVHALDFATGSEAFAVLPAATSPEAGPVPVVFEDVFIDAPWAGGGSDCERFLNRTGRHCQWRTLAFVARAEGGLIALDITQPDPAAPSPNAPGCLVDSSGRRDLACRGSYPALAWEAGPGAAQARNRITDLSVMTGPPAVGRVRVKALGSPAAEDRFVVFAGGGYDRSDLLQVGGTAVPANRKGNSLCALDAGTGELIFRWSKGLAYKDGKPQTRGLAAVPGGISGVDSDGDGSLDAVFFGDLNGSLWRLQLDGVMTDESMPELVFDATVSEKGLVGCLSRNPDGVAIGCGGQHGVFFAPVVLEHPAGTSPRRLGVAWVTGGGPLEASRTGPGEVLSVPVLDRLTLGRADVLPGESLEARKRECGASPQPPGRGFRVSLAPGERPASGLVAGNGYLVLVSQNREEGPRLSRIGMLGGDPCLGEDCCVEGAGSWPEKNGVLRLGLDPDGPQGDPFPTLFTAERGSLHVGVNRSVRRQSGEVVTRPLGLRIGERGMRER